MSKIVSQIYNYTVSTYLYYLRGNLVLEGGIVNHCRSSGVQVEQLNLLIKYIFTMAKCTVI